MLKNAFHLYCPFIYIWVVNNFKNLCVNKFKSVLSINIRLKFYVRKHCVIIWLQSPSLVEHETIGGVLERKFIHKCTMLLWSRTKSELEKVHVLVPKVRLVHFTNSFKAGLDTTEEVMEIITINTTKRPEKFWCAGKQCGY